MSAYTNSYAVFDGEISQLKILANLLQNNQIAGQKHRITEVIKRAVYIDSQTNGDLRVIEAVTQALISPLISIPPTYYNIVLDYLTLLPTYNINNVSSTSYNTGSGTFGTDIFGRPKSIRPQPKTPFIMNSVKKGYSMPIPQQLSSPIFQQQVYQPPTQPIYQQQVQPIYQPPTQQVYQPIPTIDLRDKDTVAYNMGKKDGAKKAISDFNENTHKIKLSKDDISVPEEYEFIPNAKRYRVTINNILETHKKPGSTKPGSEKPGSTKPGSTKPGSTKPRDETCIEFDMTDINVVNVTAHYIFEHKFRKEITVIKISSGVKKFSKEKGARYSKKGAASIYVMNKKGEWVISGKPQFINLVKIKDGKPYYYGRGDKIDKDYTDNKLYINELIYDKKREYMIVKYNKPSTIFTNCNNTEINTGINYELINYELNNTYNPLKFANSMIIGASKLPSKRVSIKCSGFDMSKIVSIEKSGFSAFVEYTPDRESIKSVLIASKIDGGNYIKKDNIFEKVKTGGKYSFSEQIYIRKVDTSDKDNYKYYGRDETSIKIDTGIKDKIYIHEKKDGKYQSYTIVKYDGSKFVDCFGKEIKNGEKYELNQYVLDDKINTSNKYARHMIYPSTAPIPATRRPATPSAATAATQSTPATPSTPATAET